MSVTAAGAWVEHRDVPLTTNLPVRLALHFHRSGAMTVDGTVVGDDGAHVTVDLRRAPHAWARVVEGQHVTLLRRRGDGIELARTRVVARHRGGYVVELAAPDGWRRLQGARRYERQLPVEVVVQADGASRRLVGRTRDVSTTGVCFTSPTAAHVGEAAAIRLALPGGDTPPLAARVVDVEEPRFGGDPVYTIRCELTAVDSALARRIERGLRG